MHPGRFTTVAALEIRWLFVTALKHLREQDGSLDLVITSPRVMKVFELTGLDVLIPIHENRAAALAS
jgi:anti-sigma B factor antagonist